LSYARQVELCLEYKGVRLDCAYRIDLLVESTVVVEIKTVSTITPIHLAQVLTYMKLGGWQLGLMLNFHTEYLRSGIRRLIL
jgi:GxxExxY protein